MAVNSETSRISYAGNNSTSTAYAVPFVFLENSHLAAVAVDSAGAETSITLTNHTGAGVSTGGTVRTSTAVPTTSTLLIYREVPATQATSYEEGGDFPAASHERALDKLTMIAQQLDRAADRAVKIPEGETTATVLPAAQSRASRAMGFGSAGAVAVSGSTLAQIDAAVTAINTIAAASSGNSAGIAHIASGTGATATTVQAKLREVVSVKDFGAVGDGIADDETAWNNWKAISGVKSATGSFLVDDEVIDYTRGFLAVGKLAISESGWDVLTDPTYGRSTPKNAIISLGGHYDELGSASRNYKWGVQSWLTNPGTMPMTNVDAVSQGWLVRGAGFAVRQFGAGGDGHAIETLSGQWASSASVTTTSGSAVLTVAEVLLKGSRFCVGDPISGTNIPSGATIVSVTKSAKTATGNEVSALDIVSGGSGYVVGDTVTLSGGTSTYAAQAKVLSVSSGAITALLVTDGGNYTVNPSGTLSLTGGSGSSATATATMIVAGFGNPSSLTISANATGTGSNITATVLSTEDTMNIGVLVSGSGAGGTDGTGNKNGRGIQFQSYGDAAFYRGIVFSSSALRADGTGIQFSSGSASRGISFESFSLDQAVRISGGTFANLLLASSVTCTGSAMSFSGVTATNGINFSSSNTFSGAAITLDGQNIATTTTNGMKIGTNYLQKIGFWGATQVQQPTAVADATDAPSVITQLNALLGKLRTIGLIAT